MTYDARGLKVGLDENRNYMPVSIAVTPITAISIIRDIQQQCDRMFPRLDHYDSECVGVNLFPAEDYRQGHISPA